MINASEDRVGTLRSTLKTIVSTYGVLLPSNGQIHMRYVNQSNSSPSSHMPFRTIRPLANKQAADALVDVLVDRITFQGFSRIGTALRDIVFEQFVYRNSPVVPPEQIRDIGDMYRPLLVLILMDQEVSMLTLLSL